jgi:hypothetical protein
MYQQYSQYQQQHQQQHYVQSSVESGMVWNGTSWVSSFGSNKGNNGGGGGSGITSININSSVQQNKQHGQVIPTNNPVQTYTQYYHGWIAHEKWLAQKLQQRQQQVSSGAKNNTYNTSVQNKADEDAQKQQQLETEKQWAKYYADESSRAAHYFYQNPNATSAQFDLPPPPPPPGSVTASSSSNRSENQRGVVGVATTISKSSVSTVASSSNNNTTNTKATKGKYHEGSLTRYLKRNLEMCRDNEQEKKRVQSEIEKKIAEAIQEGTLQSRNWDMEPMIITTTTTGTTADRDVGVDVVHVGSISDCEGRQTVTTTAATPTLNVHQQVKQQQPRKTKYYGNYDSAPSAPVSSTYLNGDKNNYYGPGPGPEQASSNSTTPAQSSSNRRHDYNYGNSSSSSHNTSYYGPASNDNKTDSSDRYNTSSSFPAFSTSSSPLQKENKNRVKNRKRKERDLSTTRSTSSLNGRRQVEQEEDFMALPGPNNQQEQPKQKSKNPRTNKLVATKEVHVDGIDASYDALTKRANRFCSHHTSNNNTTTSVALSDSYDKYMGKGLIGGVGELDETDYEHMTVKGTSTKLDKEYLRLTAPPRPELVRPLVILQEHLKNLKLEYYDLDDVTTDKNKSLLAERERTPQKQWINVSQSADSIELQLKEQYRRCRHRRDYLWFCSQLKAVRQDCTVQRIQGEFAVDVYETHARIALQEGDLNE